MILAMACFQLGRSEEAQAELNQGSAMIENWFATAAPQAIAKHDLLWWDWVDARILQREATALIGENVAPADPDDAPNLSR
jgi:hypothetical protein